MMRSFPRCWSHFGRQGGTQALILGNKSCFSPQMVLRTPFNKILIEIYTIFSRRDELPYPHYIHSDSQLMLN